VLTRGSNTGGPRPYVMIRNNIHFEIITKNISVKHGLNDMNFTPLANKEKQKRHLACMMAYGKDMPETPHGPKILHRAKREPKIPENVDFLNDRK
jgi:hypothetical protein